MDLCLIIYSSGSIKDNNPVDGSYDNWILQLEFLSTLVGAFKIGPEATRVGAVVFSEQVILEFSLDTFTSVSDTKNAIESITYLGGTTNTPAALRLTKTECFGRSGNRRKAHDLAILVTDGLPYPTNRRSPAIAEAQALRDSGVTMISIGITDVIDAEFLKAMSSPPQQEDKNYFVAPSFTALVEIAKAVVEGGVKRFCGTLQGKNNGVDLLCILGPAVYSSAVYSWTSCIFLDLMCILGPAVYTLCGPA